MECTEEPSRRETNSSLSQSLLVSSRGNVFFSYFYRTPSMGTTYIDRCMTKLLSSIFWFWFTYNMYYNYGHIFVRPVE